MKIAIFTDTYTPQINGVVTSTQTFVQEFEKLGHEVLIICPKMDGGDQSSDKIWRLWSVPYPFQKEYRLPIPLSRKLKEFKNQNIDIIHAQTPFTLGYLALYLGKKYKIPVVHTYHTFFAEYLHYVPLIPRRYMTRYALLQSRRFCHRCAAIVAPSVQMKKKLKHYKIESPIEVIPTGIDLDIIHQLSDKTPLYEKWNLNAKNPIVVFAGRLGKEKNIFFLLESFKKVLNHIPAAQLIIAGDGPERDHMISTAENLGILDTIRFTGYLSKPDVFSAYAMAQVMMFPSVTETQGLSVIECLSVGTPVVGINKMGVADVLKDNQGGFLCSENIEEYSQKVIDLLSNPALHRQKQTEARERANAFSASVLAKQMIALYEQTITPKYIH